MAIRIGSYIEFQGKYFLDKRQGLAKNENDLLNWDIPVPEGFEVFLNGEWYLYKSTYNSEITGHFIKRDQKIYDTEEDLDKVWEKIGELEDKDVELETDINNLQDTTKIINNTIESFYADTVQDLLRESEWIINGRSYVRKGIIVSVINDPDTSKNGAYILKNEDYTSINNWIKLIDRKDLIISSDYSTQSSDNLVYSSKKTDNLFFRKDIPQTVTQEWTHTRDIIMGNKVDGKGIKFIKDPNSNKNLVYGIFDNITANTSDILDLPDQIFKYMQQVGVTNLLKNTGFLGNYEYLELNDNTNLDYDITPTYNDKTVFWEGEKTWELIEIKESTFGYGIRLTEPYSFLKQIIDPKKLIPEESYVISFNCKGKIITQIDGKLFYSKGENIFSLEKYRFSYSGSDNIEIVFTGNGEIYNIKLERGTIATDWMPCETDKTPGLDKFQSFDYLKTALEENSPLGNNLKNILFLGNQEGGISGIWGSKVMIWSGGDYENSCKILSRLENESNNFIDPINVNSIITYNGEIYYKKLKSIYGDLTINLEELPENNSSLSGKTFKFNFPDLNYRYLILFNLEFTIDSNEYYIETRDYIIPNRNKKFKSLVFKNNVPQGSISWDIIYDSESNKYYLYFIIDYLGKTETDHTKITNIKYKNGKSIKIIPN